MTSWCLVVEDEPALGEMIRDNLLLEGHGAELVADGEAALARIRRGGVDLVVLDVMLPRRDGFSILSEIRKDGNDVPVLVVSARSRDADRILGLELEADDYLGKPFHLKELLLRVNALLRRARAPRRTADVLTIDGNRIDFRALELRTSRGTVETLTDREAKLLKALALRDGEVVTRRELVAMLFGSDSAPTTRTLDNLIVNLRRMLGDDPRSPRLLHTLRGIGYRMTARGSAR
jgi:two-component system alkaline phosphatase synthesis response regulator PhoP